MAVLLCGCSTTINLGFKPQPLATPWEARKPQVYIAGVSDRSGVDGRISLGPSGRGTLLVQLARPLDRSVDEALRAELGRLDVPLAPDAAHADASMTAVVTGLRLRNTGGLEGTIEISFTIKGRDGAVVYSDQVAGRSGTMPGTLSSVTDAEAVLDAALADAMKQVEDLFLAQGLTQKVFAGAGAAPASAAAIRSDIDDLPSVKPVRRAAHAVVIGIESHRQQLPPADFAASDARLMAKYLTDVLGYPAENVVTLTNDGATRSDIEKYVERWLPNRVESGDSVFVYYSGHGSPNPTTGDAYLVPYDGDPTYLDQTAYPLSRLYDALAKLPTKDVTVALDSCFSGAGGRSVMAKGARPLVNVQSNMEIPRSLTVLTAAAANQISQSYQEKGHGLFTYFLLKGIGQQAVKGAVSMKDVFDFAAPQVNKIARQQYNSEQTPQWQEGFH